MTARRRPLISGNWKMHHNHFEAIQTVQKLAYLVPKETTTTVDVSLHPPFTDLRSIQTLIDADDLPFALGAQHCHWEDKGAFTGEVSPVFLAKLDVQLRHLRPQRAARAVRRDRRDGRRQGHGDPAARDDADHVRRRDARRARGRGDRGQGARPGRRRRSPGGPRRAGRRAGDRLRADLGDRHRADGDRRRTPRRCARRSVRAHRRRSPTRATGRCRAHPVRRIGQGVEHRRADGASPTSTARSSVAPASTPTSSPASSPSAEWTPGNPGGTSAPTGRSRGRQVSHSVGTLLALLPPMRLGRAPWVGGDVVHSPHQYIPKHQEDDDVSRRKSHKLMTLIAGASLVAVAAAGAAQASSAPAASGGGGELVDLGTFALGPPEHIDPALNTRSTPSRSSTPSTTASPTSTRPIRPIPRSCRDLADYSANDDATVWTFTIHPTRRSATASRSCRARSSVRGSGRPTRTSPATTPTCSTSSRVAPRSSPATPTRSPAWWPTTTP